MKRTLHVFAALALVASCVTVPGSKDPVPAGLHLDFAPKTGTLWAPFLEWVVENPSFSGNPFDVIAEARFTHPKSGERRTTQMFYDGNGVWKFRFTGTRTGEWTFVTSSAEPALDELRGRVVVEENPDPNVRGFLVAEGARFAIQAGAGGALEARLYNVYMAPGFAELNAYASEKRALRAQADAILSEVEAHGLDALFLLVANNWFKYGELRHDRHSSENPDIDTFRILETLVLEAHRRGLHLHLWMWGDERRRWTPLGVGGINGVPDRRLQRYLAARLGPLPGWTLSYAFDLEEWVTPEAVREWHRYLQDHFGWPRLLMARETHAGKQGTVFELGEDKLDVFSNDARPQRDFYAVAAGLLDSAAIPVLSERRFLHARDGIWDMDTTRRALWQFTLAGGKGAIWGRMWNDGDPYPHPEQLRIHGRFWVGRFLLEMARANELTDGYALRTADKARFVFYKEAADSVWMDLSGMAGARSAVAVDTKAGAYEEISLGILSARDQQWHAPYRSDWAIAVGF